MPSHIEATRKVTIKIIIQVEKEETKTTIEVEVNVKTYDMNKGELIDAIASGSKLTKADAGRALDATIESIKKDLFKLRIEPTYTPKGDLGCPKVEVEYTTKTGSVNK